MIKAVYPTAQPPNSAGKRKIIIASLFIIIIILSAIAIVYFLTGGFNQQGNNPTPSPTQSLSPTASVSPISTSSSTLNPTITPSSTLNPTITPTLTPTQPPSTTPLPSSTPSPASTPSGTSVVFIYDTNMTSAQDFQSLLSARGISVDLVPNSTAATWDYSSYELIIIGDDTGYTRNWGSADTVLGINGSDASILGLGEGGYAFLGKFELDIGYPNGVHGEHNQSYVVNASHPIFNLPTAISIPTDKILDLYTTSSTASIYMWPSLAEGATFLGRLVDQNAYYPIISQATPSRLYALWGFTGSPADMTQTGKDLFVNLVLWLKESR